MPTILLQEIRDLLSTFFGLIGSKLEAILDKLGLLDTIESDLTSINDNVNDIGEDVGVIKSDTTSIDIKCSQLADIKTNTGSIVTPIANVKTAVDTINTNTNLIRQCEQDISAYMNTISSNTGSIRAFTDDTATNTLNIYDKVVTIASDTTQLRADMSTIITLLQSIDSKI